MKVLTSFSYKGGAGRTVATANIATALASCQDAGAVVKPLNAKVAILDLDVFSAGTHRVFDISNGELKTLQPNTEPTIQDYLLHEMKASEYVDKGGFTLKHPLLKTFRNTRGVAGKCGDDDLVLFPARPEPDRKFNVQKYHENQLLSLILELEHRNFDYVIIDGEAGTRSMADVALRLADVILMFFRLTWQHIEGTLECADMPSIKGKPYYLIPTCVPVAEFFQEKTPGRKELIKNTRDLPELSKLNELADRNWQSFGHFWAEANKRTCIHDSLFLKGEERVLVFDYAAKNDRAANDYYYIASEIRRLHPPN